MHWLVDLFRSLFGLKPAGPAPAAPQEGEDSDPEGPPRPPPPDPLPEPFLPSLADDREGDPGPPEPPEPPTDDTPVTPILRVVRYKSRYAITPDGWLDGPGVTHFPSVRSSPLVSKDAAGRSVPYGVIWHWTAVGDPEVLARNIRTYERGKDRAASWHLIITRDGRVLQSVSFLRGSWHVGKGGKVGDQTFANVNHATVGVEMEAAGRLKRINGKWYAWPWQEKANLLIPDNRAIRVPGEGTFDNYTDAQIEAAEHLLRALVTQYKIRRDACGHGHIEYDHPRKEDPGPHWMKDIAPRIISNVFDQNVA